MQKLFTFIKTIILIFVLSFAVVFLGVAGLLGAAALLGVVMALKKDHLVFARLLGSQKGLDPLPDPPTEETGTPTPPESPS